MRIVELNPGAAFLQFQVHDSSPTVLFIVYSQDCNAILGRFVKGTRVG
jgi:hypothetical protein